MIHSRNLHDTNKPYLTEMTTDLEKILPVLADSAVQQDGEHMAPSELFQAALASCTNMTVRGVLNKRGIPFDDIFVDVSMEQIDGKTIITRWVKVVSDAPADEVNAAVERAKNCYVYKVLTGEIEVKDA